MKKVIFIAFLLLALPITDIQAQSVEEKRAEAYKRAKESMPPDLYLLYRISDRIITTNNIKRPIRVAFRNNVTSGMLGMTESLDVKAVAYYQK